MKKVFPGAPFKNFQIVGAHVGAPLVAPFASSVLPFSMRIRAELRHNPFAKEALSVYSSKSSNFMKSLCSQVN